MDCSLVVLVMVEGSWVWSRALSEVLPCALVTAEELQPQNLLLGPQQIVEESVALVSVAMQSLELHPSRTRRSAVAMVVVAY